MSLLRREKAISGPLPVYSWLNIEEPKPQVEITSESFRPLSNPDEFKEAQERMWQEDAERARARIAAATEVESVASDGRPTLTEVIGIDQTDLWPGEVPTQVPEAPDGRLANYHNGNGNISQPIKDELELEHITPAATLAPGALVLNGLKRHLTPDVRGLKDATVDFWERRKELLKKRRKTVTAIGTSAVLGAKSSPLEALKSARDKTEMLYKVSGPEFIRRHKKAVVIIGAIALTGAAAFGATESYITHGFTEHANQHANILAQPNTAVPKEFAITLPRPTHVIAHIDKHAVQHTIRNHIPQVEQLRYYGDTIWNHAKARVVARFPHASMSKIVNLTNKYSQQIMRDNHIKDAAHMFKGQHFKMPYLRLK